MQFVFKATNWQHFQNEVSTLAARLNSKPHIVTVVIEDVEEVTRINSRSAGGLGRSDCRDNR